VKILKTVKQVLFSDEFDPFDLTQLEPPKKFQSGKFHVDIDAPYNPCEGFQDSMKQLGTDLKRGIEIYGAKK